MVGYTDQSQKLQHAILQLHRHAEPVASGKFIDMLKKPFGKIV